MAVNPRHTPRPASTGMVARHGPESWPGMLRNWWPAWTGIRRQEPNQMKLIADSLTEQLLANGRAQRAAMDKRDDALDFKPVVKLFTPDAQCTWLLTELDSDGGLAFGLCDLGMGEPELGYVSLAELAPVRGNPALPIDRDLHFETDKTISAYADEARAHGHIVACVPK